MLCGPRPWIPRTGFRCSASEGLVAETKSCAVRTTSSEPADVMNKQHVIVVTLGHSSTWEFKKERRFGASSRRERDFLISKPLAFFWSAESREGRVYECSLSGCRCEPASQLLRFRIFKFVQPRACNSVGEGWGHRDSIW
jgi:hypothetical protein